MECLKSQTKLPWKMKHISFFFEAWRQVARTKFRWCHCVYLSPGQDWKTCGRISKVAISSPHLGYLKPRLKTSCMKLFTRAWVVISLSWLELRSSLRASWNGIRSQISMGRTFTSLCLLQNQTRNFWKSFYPLISHLIKCGLWRTQYTRYTRPSTVIPISTTTFLSASWM